MAKKLDLDDLKSAATKSSVNRHAERKRTTGYLNERNTSLANIGQAEHKKFLKVDPDRCRIWAGHDRFYGLLNEENCADLIAGIKTEGRQQFPAIVRPVKDNSNYDYEVICGARRHWTITWLRANNYPNYEFLIESRTLTDEEAFRLSDIENRDKQDISDYERAVKYWKAINEFKYYKTQAEMAERIGLSEDKLRRFIRLAEIPMVITEAFGDVKVIKVDHARLLAPMLKVAKQRQQLETKAKALAEEQSHRAEIGQVYLPAAAVFKCLKEAAEHKHKKSKVTSQEIKGPSGNTLFTVKTGRRGQLELKINLNSANNTEEIEATFSTLLAEHWANL